MKCKSLIVRAEHRLKSRIEVHAGVFEGLEETERRPAEESDDRHGEVRTGQAALRVEVWDGFVRWHHLLRLPGRLGHSTTTLPHIVW